MHFHLRPRLIAATTIAATGLTIDMHHLLLAGR
jgi:hypothetical protein